MSENYIEVDFEGFKFSVKQSRLSEEELRKGREEADRHKALYDYVESTGEWWRIWEEDDVLKWLKGIGPFDSIQGAISTLKDIFTPQWFKTVKVHPMRSWLSVPGLHSLSAIIPLASAIKVLGSLATDDVEKLRSNENFWGKTYELEVIAFLKLIYGKVLREFEFGPKHAKKPDAKINDFYVEIKTLQSAEREKNSQEALKQIYEVFSKLCGDIKGATLCSIDLGAPNTLNELEERMKIAVKLLNLIRIDEEKLLENALSESGVKVHIKYVPHPRIKVSSIQVTNYGHHELLELYRIAKRIIDVAEKYSEYAPLVLIIEPSIPLIFLADEKLKELCTRWLFGFALYNQPKAKIIRELWIDLTILDIEIMKKWLFNPIGSLFHIFLKLPNPFYAS
jgi:hypothetical protein